MIHKLRLATESIDNQPEPEDAESDAPLKFERRSADRWQVHSAATAFRLAGERFGEMHEITVVDFSWAGCGAVSSASIEPGTAVSVGFAAPGQVARRGVVLRCTPCGDGYRLAIQFESRMAA